MESKYPNIFQVKYKSTQVVESTLIGVIDSSGSMSSAWPFVSKYWNQIITNKQQDYRTIYFSNNSKEIIGNLDVNINKYEGGGTNIVAGFVVLNEILKLQNTKDQITIIFITDGEDNDNNTLKTRLEQVKINIDKKKKINFLTIGIGSNFPTFLAMQLREMYHTGETNIPPVFLIEKPVDEVEWSQNINQLSQFLQHNAKISIVPPVKLVPWGEYVKEVYDNTWIICEADEVKLDNSTDIKAVHQFSAEQLVDLVKYWVSELQLATLQVKDAKEMAKQTYEFVQYLKDNLLEKKALKVVKQSFHQRVLKKTKVDYESDLVVLIKEIKLFIEENLLQKLNPQEAAKRLAIGTKVGKYHDKAIKIKGLSVADYELARNEFIELFQKIKLDPKSDQEPSAILLQNQKDVFLEQDLVEGLKACSSQYDLVETLPVIGHSIQIKRTDGSMINPYYVRVISIARHHKILDTVSIQQNDNQLELPVGQDDKEKINAVLPLFSPVDADLKPILQSKLYSILMTFNVMQNADTCYTNAYLALLSNSLLFLLSQPESEWQKQMFDLIHHTIKLVYSESKFFKQYAEALINTPRIAVVTEHPNIETKCEDLSKAFLFLFYLIREGVIQEENKKVEILEAIISEVFGRFYPQDTHIESLFDIQNKDYIKSLDFSKFVQEIKKNFPNVTNYYTLQDLKNKLTTEVMKLDLKSQLNLEFKLELRLDKVWFIKDGKTNIEDCIKIYKYFLPNKEINQEKYWIWLYHSSIYRNNFERNKAQILDNYKDVYDKIITLKTSKILESNPIFETTFKDLQKEYEEKMGILHFNVVPMTPDELKQICIQRNLVFEQFKFNQTDNLLKNACQAKDCPFYLVINNQITQHLETPTLKCPAYHKTCKFYFDLSEEEIYEKVQQGKCIEWDNPHISPANLIPQEAKEYQLKYKEQILKNIKEIKEFYNKHK